LGRPAMQPTSRRLWLSPWWLSWKSPDCPLGLVFVFGTTHKVHTPPPSCSPLRHKGSISSPTCPISCPANGLLTSELADLLLFLSKDSFKITWVEVMQTIAEHEFATAFQQ
jgi:hypothetical protein